MTFEQFVKSGPSNAWVREPGIELYVRRSLPSRGTDFDLANMNANPPGVGALTRFLDKYEPQYTFYIENIHNERLIPYFKRRGYVIVDKVNMSMKKLPKKSS